MKGIEKLFQVNVKKTGRLANLHIYHLHKLFNFS